jgi:hypothetical protein
MPVNRVSADHIDAVGHWVGNVCCEVYGSKIPKPVGCAMVYHWVLADASSFLGCYCFGWFLCW